jgi:hypothetical protein
MSNSASTWQPKGSVGTILGGLGGAIVVFFVGPPIANSVAEDGLSGLGTALMVLFLLWCVGTGLGVGIALAIRSHPRPLATGLLAIPGTFAAVMVTLIVGRTTESGLFLWAVLIGVSVLGLWLARVVAMVSYPTEVIAE